MQENECLQDLVDKLDPNAQGQPAETPEPEVISDERPGTAGDETSTSTVMVPPPEEEQENQEDTSSERPLSSPLCRMADMLRREGVPSSHLQPAMLIGTGLLSSHAGFPLSVGIASDDNSMAIKLMQSCINTVPESSIMEFSRFDVGKLHEGRNDIRKKTILVLDAREMKKVAPELRQISSRKFMVDSVRSRERGANSMERVQIGNLTGFVFLGRPDDIAAHRDLFSIVVSLESDKTCQDEMAAHIAVLASSPQDDALPVERRALAKMIEALQPEPVTIPYAGQLTSLLRSAGVENARDIETILMMIKIVVIVNGVRPLSLERVITEYLGVTPTQFEGFARKHSVPEEFGFLPKQESRISLPGSPSGNGEGSGSGLCATKADYYYARLLLGKYVSSHGEELTPRERRVFNAISDYNREQAVAGGCFVEPSDNKQIIEVLEHPENLKTGVDMNELMDRLNSDGGEHMKRATLDSELKRLIEKKFARSAKLPGKNKLVYFVTTLDTGSGGSLPEPSMIDPQPMKVINPFTGEEETI